MTYRVFTRTWWRENTEWPDGLEPHAGTKHYHACKFETEDGARRYCQEWNHRNPAGRLSNKAEFEEAS